MDMMDCETHGKVTRDDYEKCAACKFEEDFLTSDQWKEEADKLSGEGDFLGASLARHASWSAHWTERHGYNGFKFTWGDRLIEKATGKRCRVVGSSRTTARGGVVTRAVLRVWFLERDEDGALYLETRELIEDALEKAA